MRWPGTKARPASPRWSSLRARMCSTVSSCPRAGAVNSTRAARSSQKDIDVQYSRGLVPGHVEGQKDQRPAQKDAEHRDGGPETEQDEPVDGNGFGQRAAHHVRREPPL